MIRYPTKNCWACDEGWFPLIEKCLDRLNQISEFDTYEIIQIKEKLGRLSILTDGCSSEFFHIILETEQKSLTICEICGNPGQYRPELIWKRTLCQKHFMEIQNSDE